MSNPDAIRKKLENMVARHGHPVGPLLLKAPRMNDVAPIYLAGFKDDNIPIGFSMANFPNHNNGVGPVAIHPRIEREGPCTIRGFRCRRFHEPARIISRKDSGEIILQLDLSYPRNPTAVVFLSRAGHNGKYNKH